MFPPEAWRWRKACGQSTRLECVNFTAPYPVCIYHISTKYLVTYLNRLKCMLSSNNHVYLNITLLHLTIGKFNYWEVSPFNQNMFYCQVTVTNHTSGYTFSHLVRVRWVCSTQERTISSPLLRCNGNLLSPSMRSTLSNLFPVSLSHFLCHCVSI